MDQIEPLIDVALAGETLAAFVEQLPPTAVGPEPPAENWPQLTEDDL